MCSKVVAEAVDMLQQRWASLELKVDLAAERQGYPPVVPLWALDSSFHCRGFRLGSAVGDTGED